MDDADPDKTTVIAVYNPKGGVGKTTTACNLAAGLALKRRHEGQVEPVLLVDLDRQGNCAHYFRVEKAVYNEDSNPDGPCISKVLTGRMHLEDALLEIRPGLDLLPSTRELEYAVMELVDADRRVNEIAANRGRPPRSHVFLDDVLVRRLGAAVGVYRYIVLDCPPDTGRLKRAIFRFADLVIAPTQLHPMPIRMTGENTQEIADFEEKAELFLVLPTMTSPFGRDGLPHHLAERQMYEALVRKFGRGTVAPPIPKSVRFEEASGIGKSIFEHDTELARSYGRLVEKVSHV